MYRKVIRKAYDLRGCKQDTTFLSSQGVYRYFITLKRNSKKEDEFLLLFKT
jgi:hypothetical protein